MATPSDEDRQALLESFASGVSLIECAERLQEWGAAPEQRLAIWIRRLPEVGEMSLGGPAEHAACWAAARRGALAWFWPSCIPAIPPAPTNTPAPSPSMLAALVATTARGPASESSR
jgi:hypothetical protein